MEKFAPIQMLKKARAWIDIYNFNIKNEENEAKGCAIVCFFFGLEFYFKALLITFNKNFEDGEELKKLGHSFEKIYSEIEKCINSGLLKETEKIINKFNLFEINVIDLRYPPLGTGNDYYESFYKGNHELNEYFELLDLEIKKEIQKQ